MKRLENIAEDCRGLYYEEGSLYYDVSLYSKTTQNPGTKNKEDDKNYIVTYCFILLSHRNINKANIHI